MQKIKLDGKNKKVTITRYYGYRQASQPNKDAGPNMANYKTYEILKDYSLKSIKQNLKLSKENAKETEGTDKELKTRAVFEAIVIPPALTTNQKATNFNGIPVNSKISTIIGAAFKACYAKGQLALSNPVNDLVLDNTFGSCTTGIACINTNRNFIGIENNMDYFNISLKRVEEKRKEKEFNLITSFGDGM
jgi:hypothetical protein